MPKLNPFLFPAYRRHKQSGQAIVTLSGKDHLLGPFASPQSRQKYDRLIAQWLAQGRRPSCPSFHANDTLAVSRVIAEFWAHAQRYYVNPDGDPSDEAENFRVALMPLRRLYGSTDASKFGPLALQAVQQEMIRMGWCRTYINRQCSRIKQVFKWAVAQEIVAPAVHHALSAVAGLRKGKSAARESEPVRPVAEEHVKATLPHLSRQIGAMIQLQLLTGMRPGEVVILRGSDLDTAGKVWVYRPQHHKTEHHEIDREIRIGPKAQAIIGEFWKTGLTAYLFDPRESEAERREKRHRERKTRLSCGNVSGSNTVKKPKRRPTDRYTVESYRRAIARACEKAFPPPPHLARRQVKGLKGMRQETPKEWRKRLGPACKELLKWTSEHSWSPNQLRHTAATKLRHEFGIDVAQSVLGHRLGSSITEIYAEVDAKKVADIMEKVG